MAKIQSYYISNIQKELSYIDKDLTENELRANVNIVSIKNVIDSKDKDEVADDNGDLPSSSRSFSSTELAINNIVDLTVNIDELYKESDINTTPIQVPTPTSADLDYDPDNVLNGFLKSE